MVTVASLQLTATWESAWETVRGQSCWSISSELGNRDVITGCKYGEPNAISKSARCMKT